MCIEMYTYLKVKVIKEIRKDLGLGEDNVFW